MPPWRKNTCPRVIVLICPEKYSSVLFSPILSKNCCFYEGLMANNEDMLEWVGLASDFYQSVGRLLSYVLVPVRAVNPSMVQYFQLHNTYGLGQLFLLFARCDKSSHSKYDIYLNVCWLKVKKKDSKVIVSVRRTTSICSWSAKKKSDK